MGDPRPRPRVTRTGHRRCRRVLALAAGLWFAARRGVAAAAAAFAFVFAVLDVAEVSHQLDEDRDGLAALAVAIAIGHALATLAAGRASLRPDTTPEVS